MYLSTKKAIVTGNHHELYSYKEPYSFGYKVKKAEKNFNISEVERLIRQQDYLKTAEYRAVNKIYRLAKGNMYKAKDIFFITIDFNREMTDLKTANKIFTLFIKRYSYSIGHKIRYIAVPEFQSDIDFNGVPKPNGGSVHYHMIVFNHDKMIAPAMFAKNIWKNGGCKIIKGYRTKGLCRYMTKYISKSFLDPRYKSQKRYFFSLEAHTNIYKDEYRVNKILKDIKQEDLESSITYNIYDYTIEDKTERMKHPKNVVTKHEYMVGIGGVGGVVSPP